MKPRPQLLVMAKTPVPGRVKTRLCPPATPGSAARIAAAALADTLDTVAATPASHRTLVLANPPESDVDGRPLWTADQRPPGIAVVPQRGTGLADRLANAHADTAASGSPTLLIGMDTPQVTAALLTSAATDLARADAVLGMAADGGWWALGLNDPGHAEVLRGVPMSTPDTGRLTLEALNQRGLRVTMLPVLRDVDTAADAHAVAAGCPRHGRFERAVAALLARDDAPDPYRDELAAIGSGGLS